MSEVALHILIGEGKYLGGRLDGVAHGGACNESVQANPVTCNCREGRAQGILTVEPNCTVNLQSGARREPGQQDKQDEKNHRRGFMAFRLMYGGDFAW